MRPVSELPEGELSTRQCTFSSGLEVVPMDLFEVEVGKHRPLKTQRENWVVSATPWRLISRPAPVSLAGVVRSAIVSKPPLLGCQSDRRSLYDFPVDQHAASLALVTPRHATWQVTTSARNKMQVRCRFELGPTTYDVVVTDPQWKQLFRDKPFGSYENAAVGLKPTDRLLLCMSIGEPYRGFCYLLAAAVIRLDASWRRSLLT